MGIACVVLALVGAASLLAHAKPFVVHRAPSATPADPYPSGYDAWIAQAVAGVEYHGPKWSDGTYIAAPGVSTWGQYEPGYGFLRIAQHIGGDATLEGYAEDACHAWRDGYSIANSGVINGYLHYTDHMRLDWTENGNTTSRDALIDQAVSATYATASTATALANMEVGREVAYAAIGYINSEVYCGEAHNARLEPYMDAMLGDPGDTLNVSGSAVMTNGGHIEQRLGGIETDENGEIVAGTENDHNFDVGTPDEGGSGYSPFIDGSITGYALIRQYELAASINGGQTPDARTIPKLVRLFDAHWSFYWMPDDDAMKYRWISTTPAPALNCQVAVIYWWLYKQTGDIRHLQRGDLLFNGTVDYEPLVSPSTGGYKEFYQLIRWTIDGLEWRAQGVALHGGFLDMERIWQKCNRELELAMAA